jgi:sn-glycerol 3-phosphate transport system ATP-binding protein
MYARPATSFAASFIGTPPMNLFPLERRGPGMVVQGTDGPVLAPPSASQLVGGIRPESLRLAERGIPARVEYAEYLGADTVVACQVADVRMLARLPGRVVIGTGAAVTLATDAPIHLFDSISSQRIDDHLAVESEVVTGLASAAITLNVDR